MNFVVYNGNKRRKYPYFESLSDYFDIPWMAKLLLDKSFFLINLHIKPDYELARHEFSSIMELLLKRASDGNFITWLRENYHLIAGIPSERVLLLALPLSIEYALQAANAEPEEMLEIFSKIYPQLKETIMTAATKLEKRGIEKGIEKGIEQNKLAIARNMLIKGYDIKSIQEITELAKEMIENLQKGGA